MPANQKVLQKTLYISSFWPDITAYHELIFLSNAFMEPEKISNTIRNALIRHLDPMRAEISQYKYRISNSAIKLSHYRIKELLRKAYHRSLFCQVFESALY
ncbi:MAG: hypothetical protein A3J76_05870 [Candidatus Moranbacteria bacterium RBG_13_45_13]|nr:MAG: hypothetical protein A3J76_05870 [Candidatus Moranbacteria bacterium RBG_13_45_13]